MESDGDDIVLILKGKKGTKSMKEIRAYLDKKTRTPHSLSIKVAFFWVTVDISNLKSDGLGDEIFVFPRKTFVFRCLSYAYICFLTKDIVSHHSAESNT